MLHFLQPIFAALIGAAISLFGLLQTIHLWPTATVWQQVALAAPELLTAIVFLACAATTVAGLAMVVVGVRAARQRLAQLRRLRLTHERELYPEPPEQWA